MQKVAFPFQLNVGVEENSASVRQTRLLWSSILLRLLLCACISLVVTLAYAYFFNRHYQVQTRVFVSNLSAGAAEKENGTVSAATDQEINDRRDILRSRSSLLNIVQKLNLSVRYQKIGLLSSEDLYLKSPLRFQLIRAGDLDSKQFTVKIVNQHSFLLSVDGSKAQEYTFDTMYTDKIGSWRIIKMPNLSDFTGSKFRISVQDPAHTADELLNSLEVTLKGNPAREIDLQLEESMVLRAVDILQELCAAYLQSNQIQKEKLAQLELRFIAERLTELEKELAAVDKNIRSRRDAGAETELSVPVSNYLEQVRVGDTKLIEVDLQLASLRALQGIFNKPVPSKSVVAMLAASAPSLNFAILHLQQLQNEYESLTKTHLQQDPEVSLVTEQISDSRQEIQRELKRLIKPLDLARIKITSENEKLGTTIRNAPETEKEMAALIRRKANLQQLYVSLMQQKEAASMGHAAYLAFSKPQSNNFHVGQTWPVNYAVALLGFGIPAIFSFLQGLFGGAFRRKT